MAKEIWDIREEVKDTLRECSRKLTEIADEMEPITGDGYGHVYVHDDEVKLCERLKFLAEMMDDLGDRLGRD
jgi:hypothetical protein